MTETPDVSQRRTFLARIGQTAAVGFVASNTSLFAWSASSNAWRYKMSNIPCSAFEACIGQRFELQNGETRIEVELIEATESSAAAAPMAQRQPFSVLVRAKAGQPIEQGLFEVCEGDLRGEQIFFVPISVDDDGVTLEAVFS